MTKPTYSFELWPPRSEASVQDFQTEGKALALLNPSLVTVTYGAGGSTKDGTLRTLNEAAKVFSAPLASHLTYISTPKTELDLYIDQIWDLGIRHIIALRGDLPTGKSFGDYAGDEYYQSTPEFITAILDKHLFDITVAAYPETHPDATSRLADIQHLKLKFDAGAKQAFTQLFFDNRVYFDFAEECRTNGIMAPVYPGLLPLHDFEKACRFSKRCGAKVPQRLHDRFNQVSGLGRQKLAADLLLEQVEDLVENGVQHIHFFTLNKSNLTQTACEFLQGFNF